MDFLFFNDPASTEIYTLSLHDALPISVLVGSVGSDFADYDAWLSRHGVDTRDVRWSELKHTARFVCTTDAVNNQIASFYSGAMAEACQIELAPVEIGRASCRERV